MKTLSKFILIIAVIGFFTACDSSDDFMSENDTAAKRVDGKVTLGFNVVFAGEYQFQGLDAANCPGLAKVINTGEGTGTHFKKMTSYFEFCVNPGDGTYPYDFMEAYFEDENGDKLFVLIESGQVLLGRVPGMPDYAVSYFKDEFKITGGTGKFQDAEGGGFTNDYNYLVEEDGYNFPTKTSHHWQGKIILKKGKS